MGFKDDRRARTRSRSSRRNKADQEETTIEVVEKESTEGVKESKKVTVDLTLKEDKIENISTTEKASKKIPIDISTEQKNEKLEKESKTVDEVINSVKSEEKRKKKKVTKSSHKDDEDEVTKALREIEEMERSGKKEEDDKQKRKSTKKSKKVDSLSEKAQLDENK